MPLAHLLEDDALGSITANEEADGGMCLAHQRDGGGQDVNALSPVQPADAYNRWRRPPAGSIRPEDGSIHGVGNDDSVLWAKACPPQKVGATG